ncbi:MULTISPECIES: hypothetical protein [unclassified Duganella]|uniref:hypothetical protein n=1 Tax=unclassified Duganella TaxID=2636909 RepID=UPI0006F67819|nr:MULTISPECIES: hypothetical protein [unclassified Duganella]KQV54299.1 hypothetical protein ASD07_07155 [Duganella sp. Root336D2]KRC03425.1 hypothetical protein ASE26_00880 [Duganella sp. Root198D2]
MPGRRPSPLAGALVGVLLGILLGAMAKGATIGWEQGEGVLALPAALLGMVSAPIFLFVDLVSVSGKGPPASLVVLPWAGIGAVLGGIVGLLSNKDQ